MLHTLGEALTRFPRAMILGADSPGLPATHLAALMAVDADVGLGVCEDGGFWGISVRRTDPRMFQGVQWSSPVTLAQTVRSIRACGLTVQTGFPWFDVDTPDDLRRLARFRGLPAHTRAWFKSEELPAF